MAIIKAVSSHASIERAIEYVTQKEKTEITLVSGLNCSPETAMDEMQSTKELYGKTGGRTYKHFVQSFAAGEQITPETAHEVGVRLANEFTIFQGFEVLIATHKDREHLHNHFIVNSVSFESGKKIQMAAKDLQKMKDLSDAICREYGLSICEKGKGFDGKERKTIVAYVKEKYYSLIKADRGDVKSYVKDTALMVEECRNKASSKEEFIKLIGEKGYSVRWEEGHKHITFIHPEGKKVRAGNLKKTYNMPVEEKELLEQFEINKFEGIQNILMNTGWKYLQNEYAIAVNGEDKKRIEDRKSYMSEMQRLTNMLEGFDRATDMKQVFNKEMIVRVQKKAGESGYDSRVWVKTLKRAREELNKSAWDGYSESDAGRERGNGR